MDRNNTLPKRIKEFTRFLKRNHAYAHFKKNFDLKFFESKIKVDLKFFESKIKVMLDGKRVTLLTYISYCRAYHLINYAFNWERTKQGSGFWLRLQDKWVRQL